MVCLTVTSLPSQIEQNVNVLRMADGDFVEASHPSPNYGGGGLFLQIATHPDDLFNKFCTASSTNPYSESLQLHLRSSVIGCVVDPMFVERSRRTCEVLT